MKVRLEEHFGGSHSKLACVKKVKEMTGLGLKESKDIVDATSHGGISEFEVKESRGEIERLKLLFDGWGFKLSGGRSEALDDLLGDMFKYVIEYLNREITYKIEEGDYSIKEGRYVIDVVLGVKIDDSGESIINNRTIIIPVDSVSMEINNL